jgi:hypothetical protein
MSEGYSAFAASQAALPYAETHYKFKLPWSPLYRRWPEIFLDGPSFCVPGVKPVFYLAIKDADFFPVRVREIELLLQWPGGTRKQTLAIDFRPETNLVFQPLDIDFSGCTGQVSLFGRIKVEKPNGASRTIVNDNFPGISPSPLLIRFLSAPLPYPTGWYGGELHCHSEYSNDPVEYGAPLRVLQEAGRALGMGYVVCTDHSYDFYYDRRRYMNRVDPEATFREYRAEALALNHDLKTSQGTLVIPGEEVSCGNHLGENVHLLVAGHSEFLPGLGDGGRRWLNNQPDLRIEEVLERIGNVPGFAAHPRSRVGALERFIFRRGMWHERDLRPNARIRGIDGLQFWNGNRGVAFSEGRDFWIQRLLAGERITPIGANDAHGDLNRCIGVKTPLLSLYHNRNHVYGNVRTVVKAPEHSLEGIQAGLSSGRLVCTDGPFLDLESAGPGASLSGSSNVDFGAFVKVTVWAGKRGEPKETKLQAWSWENGGPFDILESIAAPAGAAYLRAEAETAGRRLALTAPVYL